MDNEFKQKLEKQLEEQRETFAEVKKLQDQHAEEIKKFGTVDGTLKDQIAKAVTDMGVKTDALIEKTKEENQERLTRELDKLKADLKAGQHGYGKKGKSIADTYLKALGLDNTKDLSQEMALGKKVNIQKSYIYSDVAGSAEEITDVVQDRRIYHEPERTLSMASIIPVIPFAGGELYVDRELAFWDDSSGNNPFGGADYQSSQGDTKSPSEMRFERKIYTAKTIATTIGASKQSLRDRNGLRDHIERRLPYSVANKVDSEILNGSGASGEIEGINTIATSVSNIFGDNKLDAISRGIEQVAAVNDYGGVDYIILNARDWWTLQREKDKEGRYLFGDPSALQGPRIWGVPVVPNNNQPKGNYLVGNFAMGSQLRPVIGSATLEYSRNVNDDFVKNRMVWLAEEEFILANQLVTAFSKGTFDIPSS